MFSEEYFEEDLLTDNTVCAVGSIPVRIKYLYGL